jgi:hypothetical protein
MLPVVPVPLGGVVVLGLVEGFGLMSGDVDDGLLGFASGLVPG